ncbi:MAG: FlgD immunoglobulin-like domain containing protein, partial [Candidatus Zixiibacteriota bacterium]
GVFTTIGNDSGYVCFKPSRTDTTFQFQFEVGDGCNIETGSFAVTLEATPACSVCVNVAIETDSSVAVGTRVPVYLNVETNDQVGGFDFLIGYDVTVMTFIEIIKGSAISNWEYFTYRIGNSEDCSGSSCPSGILRIVGIADANNGPYHPPVEQLMPQGTLAKITMQVVNDQNLGGLFLPIKFFWSDCGDNTFSDPSGTELYIDAKIYDADDILIWDEFDDTHYPDASRAAGMGAIDECLIGDKISPQRCVYFHNGGIKIKHPDEIDARGDLNLNGVPYEIADAVVYTNYFIYGVTAFTVNYEGQKAASDINADGYTLTIADLVYLIRVIVGDANMIPKQSPDMESVQLKVINSAENVNLMVESGIPMGAGFMVFEYDGINPGIPSIGQLAEGMDMAYSVNESEIRVLIYSFESGVMIVPGEGQLVNIPFTGQGEIRLKESSFATFHGEMLRSSTQEMIIPSEFRLEQNYPNPFNPSTTIEFSMPIAGFWEMEIFNIQGQIVRHYLGETDAGNVTIHWDGQSENGQTVASGIYFYRVNAGEYSDTKKMTLIK